MAILALAPEVGLGKSAIRIPRELQQYSLASRFAVVFAPSQYVRSLIYDELDAL